MFSKCITLLKDEGQAEDAMQDIFIKVLVKLSKFAGKSKFSTWLYSITYNYCIDLIRKNKKGRLVEIEDDLPGFDNSEIEDKVLLEIEVERLAIILDKIPTMDKAILLMKYQDSMPIKVIAKTFEKTESAIKMQIKRAKYKFQREYRLNYTDQIKYNR